MSSIQEIKCLAHAVYHEASGETFDGKMAVANVIINRVHDSRYPNDVCEVVTQPRQFSYLNDSRRHILKIRNSIDQAAFHESLQIAYHLLEHRLWDNTNGATHYYNPKLVDTPRWVGDNEGVMIGEHIFLAVYY